MVNITFNSDRCKGCGLCITACPKGLIAMNTGAINAQGHHPAHISSPEDCVGCGSCALICPDCVIAIEK